MSKAEERLASRTTQPFSLQKSVLVLWYYILYCVILDYAMCYIGLCYVQLCYIMLCDIVVSPHHLWFRQN